MNHDNQGTVCKPVITNYGSKTRVRVPWTDYRNPVSPEEIGVLYFKGVGRIE